MANGLEKLQAIRDRKEVRDVVPEKESLSEKAAELLLRITAAEEDTRNSLEEIRQADVMLEEEGYQEDELREIREVREEAERKLGELKELKKQLALVQRVISQLPRVIESHQGTLTDLEGGQVAHLGFGFSVEEGEVAQPDGAPAEMGVVAEEGATKEVPSAEEDGRVKRSRRKEKVVHLKFGFEPPVRRRKADGRRSRNDTSEVGVN